MSVIHYFMEDPSVNQNVSSLIPEDTRTFFVNKTEMNQQFFQIEFSKSMEFLHAKKLQMYLRKQDPQDEKVYVPKMEKTEDYFAFISDADTQKILETEPFSISSNKIEATILDAAPEKNIFKGMPVKDQQLFFGFKTKFSDFTDLIINVSPENDLLKALPSSDEDMQRASFPIKVSLRFSFTEQVFFQTFIQIMDMFAELGGIGGIIASAIAGMAVYFILLFIMDLTTVIQRKYKVEKYHYTIDYYKHNLPKYRQIIRDKLTQLGVDQKAQMNALDESHLKEGGSKILIKEDEAGLDGNGIDRKGDGEEKQDPLGKDALISDLKVVQEMITAIVPEHNEGFWCKDEGSSCENMFHNVKGEMDKEIKKKVSMRNIKEGKEVEKPKAGALDKIKIKLKLKKEEDFAEDSEEEPDYETQLESHYENIKSCEKKYRIFF